MALWAGGLDFDCVSTGFLGKFHLESPQPSNFQYQVSINPDQPQDSSSTLDLALRRAASRHTILENKNTNHELRSSSGIRGHRAPPAHRG